MSLALKHGAPTAPAWYVNLEMAKDWGRPPWEIVGGLAIVWMFRYRIAYRLEAEAAQYKSKRG